MVEKDKILLLFHGEWIAYSPTVIQLTDELERKYDVTIFAAQSKIFHRQDLNKNIVYYESYTSISKFKFFCERVYYKLFIQYNSLGKLLKQCNIGSREYFSRVKVIRKQIKKNHYKRVIAVDIKNAVYCSILDIQFDFLSLELCIDEKLFPHINQDLINCVIIQTEERYKYLFGDRKHFIFYIQNSPIFKEIAPPAQRRINGFLFAGTAQNQFGFYHCLRFLEKNRTEKMTVQGTIMPKAQEFISEKYSNLIKEGRLILSNHYLNNDEMTHYMMCFEIGFCFYNFEENSMNNFNYISAPSGKLFKYLAAGIPVVGNDILGFKFVEKEKCGILISNLEEGSIKEAILLIRKNYNDYVHNALRVAKEVSFDKSIKPYIDFINAESRQ